MAVHTRRVDDIAVIELDRPPVNAMDLELLSGLILALEAVGESDARAAVLTGRGRAFCAGVDLRQVLQGGPAYLQEFLPLLSDCFATLFTMTKPVVAAVNGHALAGGCVLVAACDLRLMAEGDGTIGVTEVPVGVPFPSWALEIMRFATAPHHLGEVALAGRRYRPVDGLARGLVDEIVPAAELPARAIAAASELAQAPPPVFAHTKRQLRQPTVDRVQRHGPDFDALADALWASPEVAQAIQEYMAARLGRGR